LYPVAHEGWGGLTNETSAALHLVEKVKDESQNSTAALQMTERIPSGFLWSLRFKQPAALEALPNGCADRRYWQAYAGTSKLASQEAAAVAILYRDVSLYPEPQRFRIATTN
jgi:hypothetical protein